MFKDIQIVTTSFLEDNHLLWSRNKIKTIIISLEIRQREHTNDFTCLGSNKDYFKCILFRMKLT